MKSFNPTTEEAIASKKNRETGKKDFQILTQLQSKKNLLPHNMKTHYKISYLNSNSKLFCGDDVQKIQGPILFISTPMSSYTLEPTSSTPLGYICLFNNNFLGNKSNAMRSSLIQLEQHPIYKLDAEQNMLITYLFEQMMIEHQQDYPKKNEVLKKYIEIIIHQTSRFEAVFHTKAFKNASYRLCSQFLELVEKQYPITKLNQAVVLKTPHDYAEKLDIHTNHLNRTLKSILGKSTSNFLNERMILEAQELLKNTDWSISQIAYTLGFEYPTYFSNLFKKGTGITAKEYREL